MGLAQGLNSDSLAIETAAMRTTFTSIRSRGRLSPNGPRDELLSESRNEWLRRRIANAVNGRNPQAESLVDLLQHPSENKRRIAVDLLAELNARAAAAEIAKLHTDPEWTVRASVALALARWGAQPEVVERLAVDPDIIVRGCVRWLKDTPPNFF